jgi:microcystin-dependent protein
LRGRFPLGATTMTNSLSAPSNTPTQDVATVPNAELGVKSVRPGGTSTVNTAPYIALNYLIYTGKY